MALRVPPAPQLPTVRQAGMPDVRVGQDTRGTHGEEVGQALQQVGAVVGQAASRALDSANDSARDAALAAVQERASPRMTEFLNFHGKAAAEASGPLYEGLQKDMEEVTKGLTPRQRQMFEPHARGLMLDLKTRAERHVAAEGMAYDMASTEALAKETLKTVGNTYDNDEATEKNVRMVESSMRATLLRLGKPSQAIDVAVSEYRTTVDEDRLRRYKEAERYEEAQALLDSPKVRERLGDKALRIEKDLKDARLGKAADAAIQGLFDNARMKGTGWVDVAQVRTMVEHLPDAVRPTALARMEEPLAREKKRREADVDAHVSPARAAYLSGETRGPSALSRVPPDVKNWLKDYAPEEWEKLKDKAREDVAQAKRNAEGRADERTRAHKLAMFQFNKDITDPTKRAAIMDMSLDKLESTYPGLHPKDLDRALERQYQLRQSVNSPSTSRSAVNEVESIVLGLAQKRGTVFTTKKEKLAEEDIDIVNGVVEQVSAEVEKEVRKRAGAPLSKDDITKIALPFFQTAEVEERFINTKTTLAEARGRKAYAGKKFWLLDTEGKRTEAEAPAPEQPSTHLELEQPKRTKATSLGDIPAELLPSLRKAAKAAGLPETDTDLVELYNDEG